MFEKKVSEPSSTCNGLTTQQKRAERLKMLTSGCLQIVRVQGVFLSTLCSFLQRCLQLIYYLNSEK